MFLLLFWNIHKPSLKTQGKANENVLQLSIEHQRWRVVMHLKTERERERDV